MRLLVVGKPETYEHRRLAEAGRAAGSDVAVLPISEFRFEAKGEGLRVFAAEEPVKRFDAVLLRNWYPYFSEALMLAEWAASKGLRVIDRALAEENYVHSKTYDLWKLREAGLIVPDAVQVMDMKRAAVPFDALAWPAVAKGVHGSQGKYVFKVGSVREARKALKRGMAGVFLFQRLLPIEEEYRVVTVGGKAAGAMRKLPPAGEFRRNAAVGGSGEKAALPRPLLRLAERASKALKREFAGVDLVLAGGKPYILEVNRSPGFRLFEQVTGIDVAAKFIKYASSVCSA